MSVFAFSLGETFGMMPQLTYMTVALFLFLSVFVLALLTSRGMNITIPTSSEEWYNLGLDLCLKGHLRR